MADFAPWLHGLKSDEPDLKIVRDFATSKGADWPYWSNDRADYEKLIDADAAADDATKKARRDALAGYFKLWQHEQKNTAPSADTDWRSGISAGKIALALFGLAFAYFLYAFLTRKGFLDSLAMIDHARGLITFFVVLATTGVIVLVALGIFWVDNADDAKKRFESAKELLSIVIGVLGTILGFYFGTAVSEGSKNQPPSAITQPAGANGQGTAQSAPPAGQAATPAPAAQPPGAGTTPGR
jgi:hypothetical protein